MEALISQHIRQHTIVPGIIIKFVIAEGKGDLIPSGSTVELHLETYQSDSTLVSSETIFHTIIDHSLKSNRSSVDLALLTMRQDEEAWVKVSANKTVVNSKIWEDTWYKMIPLKYEPGSDLVFPAQIPFLREDIISHREGQVAKRVLCEGSSDLSTPESLITFNFEFRLTNGFLLQPSSSRTICLTRNLNPSFHRGMQMVLKTMRINEKAWVLIPEHLHYIENAKNCQVWAYVEVNGIEMNENIIYPQNESFLRQENLGDGVVKKVIKEGNGEKVPRGAKIWIKLEGRTEDGFEFQKPNTLVIGNEKMYSEAWILAFESMRKGEIAWVRAEKDRHIIGDYIDDTLWFKFEMQDYLLAKNIDPKSPFVDKIEFAKILLDDGNRLYSSKIYSESKTLYNRAYHLLTVKKAIFDEIPTEVKEKYFPVRIRAALNIAQISIVSAETMPNEPARLKYLDLAWDRCEEVIKYDPNNLKAHYRKATILQMKNDLPSAYEISKFLLKKYPENADVLKLHSNLERKLEPLKAKEKFMCKHIFEKWETEKEAEKLKQEENTRIKIKKHKKEWSQEDRRIIDEIKNQIENGEAVGTIDMSGDNCMLLEGSDSEGEESYESDN
ncbi:unnamed protein product [Blepharisma stoltei]|uniref:Peptidylprolyl isomerase n=1 Tax=Blepharisma stoltei TaxID=1481888 RepID=A0AAU9K832_9CILI|nr:unnamed protein product [Blepharisma stoltei]